MYVIIIHVHYVCFKDKLDGFVPTHFFGWWLKVSNYYSLKVRHLRIEITILRLNLVMKNISLV